MKFNSKFKANILGLILERTSIEKEFEVLTKKQTTRIKFPF